MFRTLIEHAPEAIVVFSGETGQFVSCNENATRLYGLSRDELLKLTQGASARNFSPTDAVPVTLRAKRCLRILGFQSPAEMIGKHPAETSAPIQPNGERVDVLARKHIEECLQQGSARFDWLARNTRGEEIPIEIVLTRIELGGRRLIQAVFNDITERKRAEAELRASAARLRESEARFSTTFRNSPISIALARLSDRKYIEVNEAFLRWTKYQREEVVGRTSTELGLWEDAAEREAFWRELQREGRIREKECRA